VTEERGGVDRGHRGAPGDVAEAAPSSAARAAFGGERGSDQPWSRPRPGEPDHRVVQPTRPEQGADIPAVRGQESAARRPEVRRPGRFFSQPILHGLCTYGVGPAGPCCRPLVRRGTRPGSGPCPAGSADRYGRGESLTVSVWQQGGSDTTALFPDDQRRRHVGHRPGPDASTAVIASLPNHDDVTSWVVRWHHGVHIVCGSDGRPSGGKRGVGWPGATAWGCEAGSGVGRAEFQKARGPRVGADVLYPHEGYGAGGGRRGPPRSLSGKPAKVNRVFTTSSRVGEVSRSA